VDQNRTTYGLATLAVPSFRSSFRSPSEVREQKFPRCKPSGTVGFILVKDYSVQNGGNVPQAVHRELPGFIQNLCRLSNDKRVDVYTTHSRWNAWVEARRAAGQALRGPRSTYLAGRNNALCQLTRRHNPMQASEPLITTEVDL